MRIIPWGSRRRRNKSVGLFTSGLVLLVYLLLISIVKSLGG